MAADRSVRVEVRGLRELGTAFRAVTKDLQAGLKSELLGVADMVAGTARSHVPHRSGKAAGSIKARASSSSASIAFGGQAAPYFPWLDFGGSTGRGHVPKKAWSGAIRREWRGVPVGEGRYVYPAIREHNQDIREAVDEAIENALIANAFETRGGP